MDPSQLLDALNPAQRDAVAAPRLHGLATITMDAAPTTPGREQPRRPRVEMA